MQKLKTRHLAIFLSVTVYVFAAILMVRSFSQTAQCPPNPYLNKHAEINEQIYNNHSTVRESSLRRKIGQQYSISPTPCAAGARYLVVLICFSRPDGQMIRQVIRETWGQLCSPVCGVRLLFMIGRVRDKVVQQRLIREAQRYGDIIQSNQFDDVYRSASLKALRLLQWGSMFCPNAVYITKMDDDNWLNVPRYVQFLRDHQHEDFVYGPIFHADTLTVRTLNYVNGTDPYFVPREEYAPDKYPEYLSGVLYAFPTRFIHRVLEASKRIPTVFHDDVYVCGILVNAANLTRKDVPFTAADHQQAVTLSNCPKCDTMSIHYSSIDDMRVLWADTCCTYNSLC